MKVDGGSELNKLPTKPKDQFLGFCLTSSLSMLDQIITSKTLRLGLPESE